MVDLAEARVGHDLTASVLRAESSRATSISELVAALRVRQWTKNLLLFAGLLFSASLGDPTRWLEAVAAFTAFCAVSSASYLVNDVCDAERDRLHPRKRLRPIARGSISRRAALAAAAALALFGLALAAAIGPVTVAILAGFAAVQLAYSVRLKHVAFVDVLVIATLFVVRAAAGAQAIDVRISPWLLVCTALLALFLGLSKRRAELRLQPPGSDLARPSLTAYRRVPVDRLMSVVAAATVLAYGLYVATSPEAAELAVTVVLVVSAVARYLMLVRRRGEGEEPERLLLHDRPILLAVIGWVLVCGATILLS